MKQEPMSKVCAVFGGSRGIGKAIAKLLAQKDYKVAVISRNLEVAQAAVTEIGAHLALSCDVSKENEIQCTFKEIKNNLGNIDYLVNSAGISRDALLLRTRSEDIMSLLSINLVGTIQTCKVALKGSIVGHKGNIGQSIYGASKEGLIGFSKSLAKEVAKRNIRVNVVAPGFIHTDMTSGLKEDSLNKMIPLGRFGEPEEVAQSVLFLLESPYITGHVLVVDGGLQLHL
ncbi:carbonyl reductase family member 4 isoform X2 [Xenopus laevis]|uniref:3-ketoacyl-[acyl-carrier-protein] reductase beta subunit n=1 Tax=Xenopus laevis TaxID=8355 RepID=A0A8J1M1X2_XENLA|nr:carbonyl reductase family member 4 isoform X2 [Xenopus laevis]